MSTHWIDGSKIGRNDPCPCGSSVKFKDCCEYFARENIKEVDDRVGAYVSSYELWRKRKPSIESVIAETGRFDSKDFFQFLCKLGIALQEEIHTKTPRLEPSLLRILFDDVWYRKVLLWLNSKKRAKVIHRPLILTGLRILLLSNTTGAFVKEHEKEIGPILLDMNSVVIESDYTERLKKAIDDRDSRRILLASMARLGFYSNTEDFGSAIARYWAIHMHGFQAVKIKHPNEYFDFESNFQEVFGLGFTEMLSLTFGVIQHYKKSIAELFKTPEEFLLGEKFFQNVQPQIRGRVQSVFKYLSLTWEEHVAIVAKQPEKTNVQQFFSFYDHPLMQIAPGAYFPLDMDFLEYKISDGAYWQLFNTLAANKQTKELEKLRTSMGHAVEWFVRDLLKSAFGQSQVKRLWLDWDGEIIAAKKGHSIPDAVIVEGDTAFVIEITSSSLRPSEIISGDPEILENGLKRIWFERGQGSRGKLRQLQDAIESLITQESFLKGGATTQIRRYVPVLVNLRYIPQIKALNNWYRELMVNHGLTESFADNVHILDLEEVEKLCSLETDGTSWASIFQKKFVSDRRDDNMDSFLQAEGYKPKRNQLVQAWLKEVNVATFKNLFNKSFEPQSSEAQKH